MQAEFHYGEEALDSVSGCKASGLHHHHFFQTDIWMRTLSGYRGLEHGCATISESGEQIGCLPFLSLKRLGFSELYSMPFGTYGGLVAARRDTGAIWKHIILELANRKYSRINIVSFDILTPILPSDFETRECDTHVLNLNERSIDDIKNGFSENHKRNIEKASGNDIGIRDVESNSDVDIYFGMVEETARRHGKNPFYNRDLYERVHEFVDPEFRLWVIAYHDEKPCAGHLYFVYGGEAFYWDGCSTDIGRDLSANFLLFNTAIEKFSQAGLHLLNFGASPQGAESLVRFKRGWGTEPSRYFEYDYRSSSYKTTQKTKDWLGL